MDSLFLKKLICNKKNKVLLSLLVLVPLYLLILNFVILPNRLVFRHRAQQTPEITFPAAMPFLVDDCHSSIVKLSESICPAVSSVTPSVAPQSVEEIGLLSPNTGGVSYQVPTAPFQSGLTASLANASATVSYPFSLSPGAGGFTPSLSLSYSSAFVEDTASRNILWPDLYNHQTASFVGLGWNLDGLPKIVKTNISEGEPNGTPDYTMALNNQSYKLIRGTNNDWRTEPESFLRIKHQYLFNPNLTRWDQGVLGDYDNFSVLDKSGTEYTFAPALYQIFRRENTDPNVCVGKPNCFCSVHDLEQGNLVIYHTWYATRIKDRLGNIIKINYPGLQKNKFNDQFFGSGVKCGARGSNTQFPCPPGTPEGYCQTHGINGFEGTHVCELPNESKGMASTCPSEFITALHPLSIEYGRGEDPSGKVVDVLGKVSFELSPRQDYLPGAAGNRDFIFWDNQYLQMYYSKYKLDKIKIFAKNPTTDNPDLLLRTYQLNYTYTTDQLGPREEDKTKNLAFVPQCFSLDSSGNHTGNPTQDIYGCKHLLLSGIRLLDNADHSFPYSEEYSYFGKGDSLHNTGDHFLLAKAESKKDNSSAFTKKMEVTYSQGQSCYAFYDGSAGGCSQMIGVVPQIKFLKSLTTFYRDPNTNTTKYLETEYETGDNLSGLLPNISNALCQAGTRNMAGYQFLGLQTVKVKTYKEKQEGESTTENDVLSTSQSWFEQGTISNEYCTGVQATVFHKLPFNGSLKKSLVYEGVDSLGKELSKTLNQMAAKEVSIGGATTHHTILSQSLIKVSDPDTNLSRCSLVYHGSSGDDYSRYYDAFGNQLMSVAFGEIDCPSQDQENDPSSWKSLDKETADNRLSQTVTYPSANTNINPSTLGDNQYFLASQVKSSLSKIKNSQNQWEILSQTDFLYQPTGLLETTTLVGDASTGSSSTTIRYDSFNNPNVVVDPLKRNTTTTYDSSFHLFPKTAANPKNFSPSVTYDFELTNSKSKFGLPIVSTDINNLSTFTVYDSFGRPICSYSSLDYRDSLKNINFNNQQDCQNTSPKATSIVYYDDNLDSPGLSSGYFVTKSLGQNQGIYLTSLSLVDLLGRVIQTQTEIDPETYVKDDGSPLPPAPAGQRLVLVSQTKYNQFGVEESLRPFFAFVNPDSPRMISSEPDRSLNPIPAGKTTNVYNRRGEVVKVVYPDGRRIITLSTLGKSLTVDAENHVSLTETDVWGQTTSTKSFNGKVSDLDPTNREQKQNLINTVANAPRCNFTPESNQTVLSSSDQDRFCLHNEIKTVYDQAGRVKYSLDGLVSDQVNNFEPIYQDSCQQAKTNSNFTYHPDTKLKAHVSFTCYDKLSRLIFSYTPDFGQSANYVYDLTGNLLSVKDARGNILSHEYDELNRLVSVRQNNDLREKFDYDCPPENLDCTGLGKLRFEQAISGLAPTLPIWSKKYEYNNQGLLSLVSENVSSGDIRRESNTQKFEYDNFGRLAQTILNNQEVIKPIYSGAYGSLISQQLFSSVSDTSPLILYSSPKSNRFGELVEYTLGNNTKEKFSYKLEEKKLLLGKHEILSPSGTPLLTVDYRQYDSLGNLKQLSLSSPENNFGTKNWFYSYDHFNRLTKMERMSNDTSPFTYQYDRLGNLLAKNEKQVMVTMKYPDTLQEYGVDKPVHAPVRVDNQSYEYDSTGNLVRSSDPSIPTSIFYNSFNKPFKMVMNNDENQSYSYAYDVSGQRFYQNNPDKSLVLYFGNEDRYFNTAQGLFKKVQHYSGPAGILLEREISYHPADETGRPVSPTITLKFLHTDNLSSTTLITNENGQRIDGPATYTPYGQSILDLNQTQYKYTGGKKDEETGLYLFGVRYYNPKIGRFISPDPLGGGYAYAANNPIKFNDPTGYNINGPGVGASFYNPEPEEYNPQFYKKLQTWKEVFSYEVPDENLESFFGPIFKPLGTKDVYKNLTSLNQYLLKGWEKDFFKALKGNVYLDQEKLFFQTLMGSINKMVPYLKGNEDPLTKSGYRSSLDLGIGDSWEENAARLDVLSLIKDSGDTANLFVCRNFAAYANYLLAKKGIESHPLYVFNKNLSKMGGYVGHAALLTRLPSGRGLVLDPTCGGFTGSAKEYKEGNGLFTLDVFNNDVLARAVNWSLSILLLRGGSPDQALILSGIFANEANANNIRALDLIFKESFLPRQQHNPYFYPKQRELGKFEMVL